MRFWCADSILLVYRNHGKGQAIFCGLAGMRADSWCVAGMVLYRNNAGGRLVAAFLAVSRKSVVKKRQNAQYKKKCGGGQANVSVTTGLGNFSGIRLLWN